MKRTATTVAFSALALATLLPGAMAETIYVDQRYGPGGTGTPSAPYDTIQAAINDAGATEIIVFPGTYAENLAVTKAISIYGYDGPHTTRIDGSAGTDTISINRGITVRIEGLAISSGKRYGLVQPTEGTLRLRNCVFCGNTSHGLLIQRSESAVAPNVQIYNCIMVANGGSGLMLNGLYHNGAFWWPTLVAMNNIFIGNSRYAIETNSNGDNDNSGSITLNYNCYVGNIVGKYVYPIGTTAPYHPGSHSIELSPEFVGGMVSSCGIDFRLLPTSPCKDMGHPGIGFLDPDGTCNDIGAYGGPGAQNFYTSPNDGPFIRSVTIDQGMVPRGGTFTIRATGAAR